MPSPAEFLAPHAERLPPMPTAQAALEQAVAAWPQRDEREPLERALGAFERAFLLSPTDADVAARLAHGYFLWGHQFLREAQDHAGMQKSFGRGVVVAEMGLRLASPAFAARLARGEAVEDAIEVLDAAAMAPLTAYTENMGALSAARGRASGLFFAERLRACIEKMLALDERFASALPHRFMAIWFERVPSFAGGSRKQAQHHFREALRLSSDSLENVVAANQFSSSPAPFRAALLAWGKAPLRAGKNAPDGNEVVSGAAEYRVAERTALRLLEGMAKP